MKLLRFKKELPLVAKINRVLSFKLHSLLRNVIRLKTTEWHKMLIFSIIGSVLLPRGFILILNLLN